MVILDADNTEWSYFLIIKFNEFEAIIASKTIILTACAYKSPKLDFELKWREIGVNIVVVGIFFAL